MIRPSWRRLNMAEDFLNVYRAQRVNEIFRVVWVRFLPGNPHQRRHHSLAAEHVHPALYTSILHHRQTCSDTHISNLKSYTRCSVSCVETVFRCYVAFEDSFARLDCSLLRIGDDAVWINVTSEGVHIQCDCLWPLHVYEYGFRRSGTNA